LKISVQGSEQKVGIMQAPAPRLAQDIQGQAAALAGVLQYHTGAGRGPLQQAAAALRSSKKIVIVGIGASLNGAMPLENLLCSRGLDAVAIEAGELLHYRLSAYRDATFVLVSRSGESVEILKTLNALRGRVATIGVSNDPNSPLARQADMAVDLHSPADEMVAIQTYSATILSLYLLGAAATDQWEQAQREVGTLTEALPAWIAGNLESARQWDQFLDKGSTVYALGRGPSHGSALQSALLFSEIAKAPAIGMTVASFRHGPVEVVDDRFRGLIFAPQGKTRELNLALARELLGFGGSVRVIGPPPPQGTDLPWIGTPSCPDMLAPLVEIVPVQVAALRLAELRDLVVGSFRFTPQVARDETRIAASREAT
jgi:glutamine---fructose-6-phosphate transaminase (isomerizing)